MGEIDPFDYGGSMAGGEVGYKATRSSDESIDKGCGNCSHLWDEDACLGTMYGDACERWSKK